MLRFAPSLWRYKWLILFITAAGAGVGSSVARSIGSGATSVLLLIILVSFCVAVADALLLGWLDKRLEDSYRL